VLLCLLSMLDGFYIISQFVMPEASLCDDIVFVDVALGISHS
jgi:hypothetical protein